jgi:hypothetical protein
LNHDHGEVADVPLRTLPEHLCWAFAAILTSVTSTVTAGGYPPILFDPVISPTAPTDHSTIMYIAGWDPCGRYDSPTITRTGSRIDVNWPFYTLCGVPVGAPYAQFLIGELPAGDYVVHVDPCNALFEPQYPCDPMPSPPDVHFVVAAAPSLPATDVWAAALLVFGIAIVGARRGRGHI